MSTEVESESDTMVCCASCGIAEVDNTKLKVCTACKLVRYCSVKCQRDHRPQHKKECKKRASELRDEILFKQPESTNEGDCPICLLPLPLDISNTFMTCCSKSICQGCEYANLMREIDQLLASTCPFCRHPSPGTDDEAKMNVMKRIEVNDPVAMCQMGKRRFHEGDYNSAFDYYTKAAGLGDVGAHYELSVMYRECEGVEKDKKKELHHLEQAAIGGHALARHNIGCVEWNNGRNDRAVKHFIIAANFGYDDSIQALKKIYAGGDVSKEDYASALRAHQVAVDATKSPQREVGEAFFREWGE